MDPTIESMRRLAAHQRTPAGARGRNLYDALQDASRNLDMLEQRVSKGYDSDDSDDAPLPTQQGDNTTMNQKNAQNAAQELVVVDEKDVGMKAGLKHLYSKCPNHKFCY